MHACVKYIYISFWHETTRSFILTWRHQKDTYKGLEQYSVLHNNVYFLLFLFSFLIYLFFIYFFNFWSHFAETVETTKTIENAEIKTHLTHPKQKLIVFEHFLVLYIVIIYLYCFPAKLLPFKCFLIWNRNMERLASKDHVTFSDRVFNIILSAFFSNKDRWYLLFRTIDFITILDNPVKPF